MPTITDVYKFKAVSDEKLYWDYDYVDWHAIENQLYGLATFVGSGIVNGWDISTITQAEVDALPDADKEDLNHTEACMMVKVTTGDGIIGVHAAYTPEDVYIAFPLINQSIIYYIYVVETDCLKEDHRGRVLWNTEPDYDSDHNAVYLGRVITYYDEVYDEVYVFSIPEETTGRRRVLKNLEGAAIEAARDVFFRHTHSGEPDTDHQEAETSAPSKIQLGTQEINNLTTVPASTIFLFGPFSLEGDTDDEGVLVEGSSLVEYVDAKVKLNGDLLSDGGYYLDNRNGKLYLRNSVENGDIVQIIKYLDPDDTQIARGPQDDPISNITGTQPPVVSGDEALTVDPNYKLPAIRVGEIDAADFVFGTLDANRIPAIDHYGVNRIKELATIDPSVLTRTRDQLRYYLVPDGEMGYDTKIHTAFRSTVIGDVLSTPFGLYKYLDGDPHDLERLSYDEDEGRIIRIRDNTVLGDAGGEDRFHETYALNDDGEIWLTQDEGETWEELDVPSTSGLEVKCFTVSTDKVQRIVKNRLTYDYYKVLHIGTNLGLFSARFLAAKGNMLGGSDLVNVETIAWTHDLGGDQIDITALQEIVTLHIYVDSEGNATQSYDRTLYIGTEDDVKVSETNGSVPTARTIPDSLNVEIIDMLWATDNNAILMIDQDTVYISHTAEHIEIEAANYSENYWKHPLTDIDEELHVSYDFSTQGKTSNKLSKESGRPRYVVGLNDGVAVSGTDQEQSSTGDHQPYLPCTISVDAPRSIATLPTSLTVTGTGHSVSSVSAEVRVISLANAADQAARSDAEKEIADGWAPLSWNIPDTEMENVRDVVASETSEAIYDPVFGGEQQPTEYWAATDNGPWKSTDSGSNWQRFSIIWDAERIPLITRDGLTVPDAEYTLEQERQSILFNVQQRTDSVFKAEKDFEDYYAVNGGWEQGNVDMVVYVNDEPSHIPYSVDRTAGKITFDEPLGRDAVVSFSLVQRETYITDVGNTPHSEVLETFVKDEDTYTKLATDLEANKRTIKVLSTDIFPSEDVHYVEIDGETIRVKTVDDYTLKALDARPDREHAKTTEVYSVNVQRLWGIEDEIVREMGGYSYSWSNLTGANLIRLQLATRHVWNDLYHDVPGGGDVAYGEALHLHGTDDLDTTNSSSTLWSGLGIDEVGTPRIPRVVSAMVNPGTNEFVAGTDAGVWRYDGSEWTQLSTLGGAGFVHYIDEDRRGYMVVGADNGLWVSSDDGETWTQDDTFFQQQFAFDTGSLSWWSPSRTYECYGKEDGMSIVVYGWDGASSPDSFHSDHFDPVDDKRVYGFYKGYFIRIDEDTMQKKQFDSIWVMSEEGLWICYSGTRKFPDGTVNPYSAILKGREAVDPGTSASEEDATDEEVSQAIDFSENQRYIVTGTDGSGDPVYQKLRFYGAFQDERPKTVPIIFLTNDGLRVARNWRWVDPENSELYLAWEATPLSTIDPDGRIVCNCFTTGTDSSIQDGTDNAWKKYKCFVGTSNGVYRSYDGCHSMEPCQRIPGATAIYTLEYDSNGRLHAGTDSGYWYSDNDGDDWTRGSTEISQVLYPEGGYVAQTFEADEDVITKVSLYLHMKD